MDFSPLWISLKIALTATVITVLIGIPLAWFIAVKVKRGKGFLDGIITLPMVLPPTVVGFFLLLLIGKSSVIGRLFMSIDVTLTFTWIAGVLASVVVALPLMYRTARGAFEAIDKNLIYVGQTLGMSNAAIFLKVILPNTFHSIMAGVVLSFARALGEFGATIMVAGNIPGRTQTMAIAVYSAVQSGNRALAYRWVAVILCLSFAGMMIMNRLTAKHSIR